eukprot:11129376-Alexandrium_andersonii.AAC.1
MPPPPPASRQPWGLGKDAPNPPPDLSTLEWRERPPLPTRRVREPEGLAGFPAGGEMKSAPSWLP